MSALDPALLIGAQLFAGLSPAALAEVLALGRRRPLARGETVFEQGEPADDCHVLAAGRVKLSQVTAEGHQVVVHFVGPGEMFGWLPVFTRTPYPATAVTVNAGAAVAWDGPTIVALIERHPRIGINALESVGQRFHALQERYRELATERVERRIARAILRLARQAGRRIDDGVLIDFPISRQDIAEITGTTLHTVSRMLAAWETQGLIEGGRQRIVIKRPHGLVSIAEDLGG